MSRQLLIATTAIALSVLAGALPARADLGARRGGLTGAGFAHRPGAAGRDRSPVRERRVKLLLTIDAQLAEYPGPVRKV